MALGSMLAFMNSLLYAWLPVAFGWFVALLRFLLRAGRVHEVASDKGAAVLHNGNGKGECGCSCVAGSVVREPKKILIAYATQSNTACKLSHQLFSTLSSALLERVSVCASGSVQDANGPFKENCCQGDRADMGTMPELRVLQLTEHGRQCSVEQLMEESAYGLVVFFVSTHSGGTAPESSRSFAMMLKDAYMDFRVPRDALARVRFAIFGLGDIAYGAEHFNRFAKDLYTWCKGLGGKFVVPPVYASEANMVSLYNVFSVALVKWVGRAVFTPDGVVVKKKLEQRRQAGGKKRGTEVGDSANRGAGESRQRSKQIANDSDGEEEKVAAAASALNGGMVRPGDANEQEELSDSGGDDINSSNNNDADDTSADDVEDIVMNENDTGGGTSGEPPEMIYPRLRENLQRQGYHLVGTHSGVKLCRWTKAMLRGRGGCYKHTFYNIASYQCMEMTPSLACANKCVFCWRHHTNPVSRSFRWKVDPPLKLVEEGLAGHRRMIKQMRGVPGVTPERLEEAMQVRHCALSLVGEPIMYPEINAFVDLLHERNISSFMVTNAQFPEQLRDLKPVTQLYLSIDAPTPEELQRVDRPLFEDYWERCLACVRELRRKPQRTVFRLTLVNQYNMENVAAYAELVRLGWPDFIEVKGVTYCGTSGASTLTMKDNVPRHSEVVSFCEVLCKQLAAYTEPRDKRLWLGSETLNTSEKEEEASVCGSSEGGETTATSGEQRNSESEGAAYGPYRIACEHEHSCCVLIALRRFLVHGVWHTWIDYDKFYELVRSGRKDFVAAEYAAPTPSWAVFQSEEKGFDPTQVRVRRKCGKPLVITSGC
ncbi:putative Flavodoxin Radical SAM superfamily Wyosine base formation [Trypanosoma vivax]|uniref:tRNA 4-demethylwyosine synthase (AdoMet-dependent) n=1 Tax=Trypanosoma vivax (strain Y486) TaxID=1055687 RepID=G0TZG3_TRYVY|nr:hypothetical protein TRVL_02215 [Trypanosoma vivax]KAH8617046.1 putative Flavodoxin Radical SAM superfamily Wyosine base formation [Trypanosoma vivax]CCC49366.1 conserved hypothetical protein [Trypanosoma vivax Y486]